MQTRLIVYLASPDTTTVNLSEQGCPMCVGQATSCGGVCNSIFLTALLKVNRAVNNFGMDATLEWTR